MITHYVLWKVLLVIFFITRSLVVSSPYSIYSLEQDKVCPLGYRKLAKGLQLGKDDRSAIIVKETGYFHDFTGQHAFECSFVVKASHNFGLFAVIQKMNLRKDLEKNECIDYVQFCHFQANNIEEITGNNWVSCKEKIGRHFCGLPSEAEDDMADLLAPNGFMQLSGQIGVKIFLAKKRLQLNESLEIEIAFTAFSPCKTNLGSYKLCSPDADMNTGTCIYKEYFNDGIINCPFTGCADECGTTKGFDPHMGKKVTITAVTSIFLSFFFFLGCIWMCRSCELLCWSVENLRRSRPTETNMEDTAPTAPSLPQSSSDKDLPPSYATLFPDR